MSKETKRPATYADLEALPENVVGQIIDGELIVMPRPAGQHGAAHTALIGELYTPFQRGNGGPGGWWFMTEPELHFGDDVLVPDIAGWRIDRMPEDLSAPFFTLAPAWVCEVLSPSTAKLDRHRKSEIYAREGVGHVWLLDPVSRTLEVFQLRDAQWVRRGTWSGEVSVRAEPFEALELELARLWPRMPQPPRPP
ncbi:Uma2 family endonuclease [Pyxidicoccus sp. MSG2]|uniref:Uma2 family endonuclease n=1 Tax=Pyxidicoccus sp. MSG2 TaxID=2996790 RepID=UPI00226F048D|nr:Uma2 family endonuclease [Pyxidicoccus sp. MSG2]MCY1019341.1 Uma2 family endonuclease [Pyxidicoccus sp. MSG2]